MSKQLLIVPRDSGLDAKDKERLSKAGFLVLELQHPNLARLVSPDGAELGASAIALAAVKAMAEAPYNSKESVNATFVKLVSVAMQAAYASKTKGEQT